jgi:hypothetical protein
MKLMSDIIALILALAIVVALITVFPVLVATICIFSLVILIAEIIKTMFNK